MRWLTTLPCLVLAACSSLAEDAPAPKQDPAPVLAASAPELQHAAVQEKLAPPFEAAGPLPANPVSADQWFVCLRNSPAANSGRPTYSVFFKDGKFSTVRPAALIDGCDTQVFAPIDLGLPGSAPAAPAPQPSPQPPKKHHHHHGGDD